MPCYSWHPVEAARLSHIFTQTSRCCLCRRKAMVKHLPSKVILYVTPLAIFTPKCLPEPSPFVWKKWWSGNRCLVTRNFCGRMELFWGGSNCKTVGGDFNIYCSFPCSCWGKVPLDEHIFASPKHQGWAHMFVNFNLTNKTQIVHLQKLSAKQKSQPNQIHSQLYKSVQRYNWIQLVWYRWIHFFQSLQC